MVYQQMVKNRTCWSVALPIAVATLGSIYEYETDETPSTNHSGNSVKKASDILYFPCYFTANTAATQCSSSEMMSSRNATTNKDGEESSSSNKSSPSGFVLRRKATFARIALHSTKERLDAKYEINPDPIGEGAFGQVFVARHRQTGELVAVKKIWKKYSNNEDVVREMSALLQIQAHGGHPHICLLKEHFEEEEDYALVLDLIKGGELFDYLVENGAFSELDASRLVREVASALAFMHGIGLVHCDLKPENLMLSTKNNSASVKVVDFGCTEHLPGFEQFAGTLDLDGIVEKTPLGIVKDHVRSSGGTVAYSPPESFSTELPASPLDASMDVWALGIILHIMLLGFHPFDPQGDADDEALMSRISVMKKPPLDTPDTEHLSRSALDLLNRMLEPDPSQRIKSYEMLTHPWVRGETAKADVIEGSDQKLSSYRKFRSKLEAQVFRELMNWSDSKARTNRGGGDVSASSGGESLVEKAFKSLDKDGKGFLRMEDISKSSEDTPDAGSSGSGLSLSSFSDLLGENMQNSYFPAGHVVFHEGDRGQYMYFLNSGTCEVSTKDGFRHILKHGDTFGEGGLINENGRRSATIKTITPVHAIRIDRDCFQKYLLGSSSELALKIKEKVNKRKFKRAEFIIGDQKHLQRFELKREEKIYSSGDKADKVFFVEDGILDVRNHGHSVYHAHRGELLGVQSFYFNRSRDADAFCISDQCTVKAMSAEQFRNLATKMPELKSALHEMALRREFQRAIVRKLKGSFTTMDLEEVFNAIDLDHSGKLNVDELRDLLTNLDFVFSEEELKMLVDSLDLDNTGFINFEEFSALFA